MMLFGLKASRVLLETVVGREFQVGKASVVNLAYVVVKVRFSLI